MYIRDPNSTQYKDVKSETESKKLRVKQQVDLSIITSLSEDYHSIIGEQGLKLSGGERQRIIIIRAFHKNTPTNQSKAWNAADPGSKNFKLP